MVKIRLADMGDIETIMKFQFKLFSKWDSMDKIDEIDKDWFMTEKHQTHILEYIKDEKYRIYIALLNGKPVGYILCEIYQREPFLKKVGYIPEIYVLPDNRGKKIGSKLLNSALNWFKENKLIWAMVSTHILDKEANTFWERKSYKEFNKVFKIRL